MKLLSDFFKFLVICLECKHLLHKRVNSSEVSSGVSSFLDLLVRMSLPESGLSGDLSLLLVSLVLPGGGDVEELPLNGESCSGGRFRGT